MFGPAGRVCQHTANSAIYVPGGLTRPGIHRPVRMPAVGRGDAASYTALSTACWVYSPGRAAFPAQRAVRQPLAEPTSDLLHVGMPSFTFEV